jgi:hypothetical protein
VRVGPNGWDVEGRRENIMAGNDNAWSGSTADRRLFRAAPTVGITAAATAASANDPWLATVSAAQVIATDPGVGTTLRVQFIARDGFSQPSTTPVAITASGAQLNTVAVVGGATGGAVVSTVLNGGALSGGANFGATVIVTPNATTGLVDVLYTWNAGATVGVIVQHRHIIAGGEVVVA